jgi:ABC-type transport system involved in multi-copper enzyme maturation permease subunit
MATEPQASTGVEVAHMPGPGSGLDIGEAGRAPRRAANPLSVAWAIGWRHIHESLQNRSTYVMGLFFLALPAALLVFTLRPAFLSARSPAAAAQLSGLLALYFLMAGLLPCNWSVGIAAGAFAAEKEQGSLVPLLATPASNASIFSGKILGAVLPALAMGALGVVFFLTEVSFLFGNRVLAYLPLGFAVITVALMPGVSLLGAALSSMISARVNTEQVANQYGSLILSLIWFLLFGVVLRTAVWGLQAYAGAVVVVYVVAVALILISAATWRREEVMARQ